MALKKIDLPEVADTIANAKDEELRQQEIEAQNDLAAQIGMLLKEAPDIIRWIREAAMRFK